jgi:hypothetical protein
MEGSGGDKVKERPILFSTPMVQAILEGRKTQTRRVIKPSRYQRKYADGQLSETELNNAAKLSYEVMLGQNENTCPYGQIGNRLWVRETWAGQDFAVCCEDAKPNYRGKDGFYHPVIHKAGKENYAWGMSGEPKWHSGRFMFKISTRIWLEITEIRVQRLQEISEEDAVAEGTQSVTELKGKHVQAVWNERQVYKNIWDSINGKTHPWESNDWVWAISFKVMEGTK